VTSFSESSQREGGRLLGEDNFDYQWESKVNINEATSSPESPCIVSSGLHQHFYILVEWHTDPVLWALVFISTFTYL
jgi:hypothetical protein